MAYYTCPYCYFLFHISIWQELILRLSKENGSLKQSLDATNTSTNSPKAESSKSPVNGTNEMKVIIGMRMKNHELDCCERKL